MAKRNKRRRETRSSVIDELLALRLAMAAGAAVPVDADALAAAEIAAGQWERAMAAGESELLPPAMLAVIGRQLVSRGESVWYVPRGSRDAVPAAEWDLDNTRSVRPGSWVYRLTLSGPSGQLTRDTDASEVMHFRIRVDPRFPWRGRSPWAVASATARLAAALEASLSQEEGGPVGHVLPVPDIKRSQEVADEMPLLRGRVVLGETMSGGWEQGQSRAPNAREWQPVRIGPAPPPQQMELRSDVQDSLLAAAGVPVELAGAAGDAREAWRRFLFATIAPVGRIVAAEASRVLGVPVRLDWAGLAASDLQARARAYRQLRDAGMEDGEARRLCGFAS